MALATLQFYKNPEHYPKFSNTLVAGPTVTIEDRDVDLISSTLHLSRANLAHATGNNYMKLTVDGKIYYAWITGISTRTPTTINISYSVDAWRTYRDKLTLGNQYIARGITPTQKPDPLLTTKAHVPTVTTYGQSFPLADQRTMVVQTVTNVGEITSATPGQPTHYQFYFCNYPLNNWRAAMPIEHLMARMQSDEKPTNIVAMYSIPAVDLSGLAPSALGLKFSDGTALIEGWYFMNLGSQQSIFTTSIELPRTYLDDTFFQTEHRVQIVIPEAGIITLTDDLLAKTSLSLRRDIDIFSGATNYMIVSGNAAYTLSVRGGSLGAIPVIGDPLQTYIGESQNQRLLAATSDAASLVIGGARLLAGDPLGAGGLMSGVKGLLNRRAAMSDMENKYMTPPAYLGSALVPHYNSQIWTVVTRMVPDNVEITRARYGYPQEHFAPLVVPPSGYIQTENCSVSSDGSVPKWAVDEINNLFNNGLLIV